MNIFVFHNLALEHQWVNASPDNGSFPYTFVNKDQKQCFRLDATLAGWWQAEFYSTLPVPSVIAVHLVVLGPENDAETIRDILRNGYRSPQEKERLRQQKIDSIMAEIWHDMKTFHKAVLADGGRRELAALQLASRMEDRFKDMD